MRITEEYLESQVDGLNVIVGIDSKKVQYNTVGSYQLDYANGGIALHKITGGTGCVDEIINRGTKRELSDRIYSFTKGILIGMGA